MDKLYALSVNLTEKSFSVSGTEEFVDKYMNKFMKLFKLNEETNFEEKSQAFSSIEKNTGNIYINGGIYSVGEDGEIIIHTKVLGKDKAEKTRNVALIVLYAKRDKILGSELRSLCEKQACYDASNFAKTFDKDIENFIKKKISAKQWTIELTVNGNLAAKKLLDSILEAKKTQES